MCDIDEVIFEKIKLTEEEQVIFDKLKEYRVLFWDNVHKGNRDDWVNSQPTGAALSYDLYTKLTSRGIEVKFNRDCLKNRFGNIGGGPESAKFHEHIDVIDNIISFVEFPLIHDEVGDVTLGARLNVEIYCKKRVDSDGNGFHTLVSFTRIPDGWESQVWEKKSLNGKDCSQFLYDLGSIDACILPEISVLKDVFECLWNEAAEGMDQGTLKTKLDDIAKWISATEKGRPKWI